MSDTEQEGGVASTEEQSHQESTVDDSENDGHELTASAEHKNEEEKGLMGEIMDIVRSGSPPDTESKDDEKETTTEKIADEGSADVTESKEENTSTHEDNVDEKEANTGQVTNEADEAAADTKSDSKSDTKSEADDTNDPPQSSTLTTLAEMEVNCEETASEPLAAADDDNNDDDDDDDDSVLPPSKDAEAGKEKEDEIITPYLLSDDEIIAKGVAESDIEMYRKFHLNLLYSPKVWYDAIKNYSFTTDFMVLTPEEIDALLAIHHSPNDDTTPEVSAETKDVITQLQGKLDASISKYEEGAFIKLNSHSVRDAILDKCEGDHVQAVEDGVLNELEIEQQFVNAYLNWRSWRSMSYRENSRTKLPSEQRGNVVRRSFRRIRKSFSGASGGRSSSVDADDLNNATKDETPLAEESDKDKKEPEENKEEEKKEGEGKKEEEGEKDDTETKETTKEEGTSEVTAETTDGSTEENKESTTEDFAVTVEATVEKTADTANTDNEDQSKQELSVEETSSMKDAKEDQKAVKISEIEEIKEVEDEAKPKEGEKEEPKERKVPPPLFGKEQQFVKVKSETRGNKILRAFIKATNAMYRITSGEQAIQLLSTSRVIKEDLEQAKVFANISGAEAVISIQRWHADVAKYPGMQFRAFVYKNKLTAFSQKDDVAYIPNIVRYKDTIQTKVLHFFNSTVKKSFEDMENYVVDMFVGTNKIYVVDLYPFHTGTGACLFTWQQNRNVLLGKGPVVFQYIPTPFKNCYTGLQPHWQQVCTNIQQKQKRESQQSGKCLIL